MVMGMANSFLDDEEAVTDHKPEAVTPTRPEQRLTKGVAKRALYKSVEGFIEDDGDGDPDEIYLLEFTAVDHEAAELLGHAEVGDYWSHSRHGTGLPLKGLSLISDRAAKGLEQHQGNLDLFGLTALSDAAAESLRLADFGWQGLENHLDICMPVDLVSWIVGAPVNLNCTASDRVLCQL